jgi:hypothetical protein
MIQLDLQTKLYILGAIVALTQLPKILPSPETIKGLLAKIDLKKIFTSNNIVLAAVAAMILMPHQPAVTPVNPDPVPIVIKDKLDVANDTYRELLSEEWAQFAVKRTSFKTADEALKYINDRQVAVYKAAYQPINDIAAKAADGGDPTKFAFDLKNRSL